MKSQVNRDKFTDLSALFKKVFTLLCSHRSQGPAPTSAPFFSHSCHLFCIEFRWTRSCELRLHLATVCSSRPSKTRATQSSVSSKCGHSLHGSACLCRC